MEELARPEAVGWVAVLLLLRLPPEPAMAGPGLSVAFTVQVALAMLYHPLAAGAIAFVGALDLRRLRGRGRWRCCRAARSRWSRWPPVGRCSTCWPARTSRWSGCCRHSSPARCSCG
jgi:hypothetical protein